MTSDRKSVNTPNYAPSTVVIDTEGCRRWVDTHFLIYLRSIRIGHHIGFGPFYYPKDSSDFCYPCDVAILPLVSDSTSSEIVYFSTEAIFQADVHLVSYTDSTASVIHPQPVAGPVALPTSKPLKRKKRWADMHSDDEEEMNPIKYSSANDAHANLRRPLSVPAPVPTPQCLEPNPQACKGALSASGAALIKAEATLSSASSTGCGETVPAADNLESLTVAAAPIAPLPKEGWTDIHSDGGSDAPDARIAQGKRQPLLAEGVIPKAGNLKQLPEPVLVASPGMVMQERPAVAADPYRPSSSDEGCKNGVEEALAARRAKLDGKGVDICGVAVTPSSDDDSHNKIAVMEFVDSFLQALGISGPGSSPDPSLIAALQRSPSKSSCAYSKFRLSYVKSKLECYRSGTRGNNQIVTPPFPPHSPPARRPRSYKDALKSQTTNRTPLKAMLKLKPCIEQEKVVRLQDLNSKNN